MIVACVLILNSEFSLLAPAAEEPGRLGAKFGRASPVKPRQSLASSCIVPTLLATGLGTAPVPQSSCRPQSVMEAT